MTGSGYVTFVMDGRELAGELTEVREVVRASGIEPLTGARAPVTGLLLLRGHPVPVVDLRAGADPGEHGDVLVLEGTDGRLGIAVDKVRAVLGPGDLEPIPQEARGHLPSYVREVRRAGDGRPVLVVSLTALAGLGQPQT
jgi:chemotaxis signal transduction protein